MSKFCMGCMEQYEDEFTTCPHCGYEEGTPAEQALHMEPGSILQDRFIVGKAIGYGGFGVTYIAWDALLEKKVAIKEYLPSEFSTRMPGVSNVTVYNGDKSQQFHDGRNRFVDEAKRLAKLNDVSGIVRIYDSFEANNTAYIVMEYLEGETLSDRLKREGKIDPASAVAMMLPVIRSMQEVHDHGIIHRDLAPDNIFITKGRTMKVIDFGASRYATTSHSRSLTVIIKPGYSPEEQYRSRGDQGAYTDVYAMAATLYRMITGKTPPDALERRASFENRKKDTLKSVVSYCPDVDQNTENAILNAMNVRIEDRTQTMKEFAEELTSQTPVARRIGKIRKIDLLRWPLWAKIAIPLATLVLLATGLLFAMGVIHFSVDLQDNVVVPEDVTRVPSVVNSTVEHAEDRIGKADLQYMIAGKEYSDVIPSNYVLEQDIRAGQRVPRDTMLNIVISGGSKEEETPEKTTEEAESVAVPDVMYFSEAEARKKAESKGLKVTVSYQNSQTVAAGLVLSQNPKSGDTAKSGGEVKLVVSLGAGTQSGGKKPTTTPPAATEKAPVTVTEISFSSGRLGCWQGETLDISGWELLVWYSDGSTKRVNSGFTCSPMKFDAAGEQKATITYEGKQTSVNITVWEKETVTVDRVAIYTMPNKTVYNVGEKLDFTGLSLKVTYSDGSTQVVTGGYSKDAVVLDKVGTHTFRVFYENHDVSFEITVREKGPAVLEAAFLTGISINTLPSKTTYYVGEDLNTNGLTLTATYSDGSSKQINSGFTCSPTHMGNEGTTTITVAYGGATTAFDVVVKPDVVNGCFVYSMPNQTTYTVGDTFNPEGFVLGLNMASGQTERIPAGYCSFSPQTLNTAGQQRISVSWWSSEDISFYVTVEPKEDEWSAVFVPMPHGEWGEKYDVYFEE